MTASSRFLKFILFEGIIVFLLGIMMLFIPQIFSFATAYFISVGLMIYGGYKFFNSIAIRKEIKNVWFSTFWGLLVLSSGIYLTLFPTVNLVIMTSFIIAYFFLEGINTMIFAFQTKGVLRSWWINLFVAILQFALAGLIFTGLPLTALWAIGVILGINFLFAGMAMISVYMSSKFTI